VFCGAIWYELWLISRSEAWQRLQKAWEAWQRELAKGSSGNNYFIEEQGYVRHNYQYEAMLGYCLCSVQLISVIYLPWIVALTYGYLS